MCHRLAHVAYIFADVNLNKRTMNTNISLSNISSMFSSEESYRTLVDMINEMDLELMDVNVVL